MGGKRGNGADGERRNGMRACQGKIRLGGIVCGVAVMAVAFLVAAACTLWAGFPLLALRSVRWINGGPFPCRVVQGVSDWT